MNARHRSIRSPLFLLLSALVVVASCGRSTSPTRSLTGIAAPAIAVGAPAKKPGTTPTLAVAAGLTLNPTTVGAGISSTGTLTVSGLQATSATVFITSSNRDAARVPDLALIGPGATTLAFSISTRAVTVPTAVVISATLNGVTSQATLTVTPTAAVPPPAGVVTVASVALAPASVTGGTSSRGTVTLSAAAPSTGAVVALASANTAVATVPATVSVAAGASTATFAVTTGTVTATTGVLISASLNGVTRSATLSVTAAAPPPVTLSAVALAPAIVIGPSPSQGTVTLSAAAPAGGAAVTLVSSNPAVTVPGTVTVAAGATTGRFTVTTSIVTATASAVITGTFNGVSRTATLTVNVPNPCASVLGLGGTVGVVSASVPQFRATRLRVDLVGDVPGAWLNAMGGCTTSAAPTLSFFSGTATVTFAGSGASVTATGAPLAFGPLTSPIPAEPGVVLALDAAGNVLQLIWPALAGLPPGPPTLRLNLAVYSPATQAGAAVNATLVFNVRGPDGSVATFTASGANMIVPPLR